MKTEKITLSICIAALNEEKTVGNLIRSIESQQQKSYSIKEILLVSDGSTDKTVEKIKSFKNRKIKILDDNKRLGKATRMNYFFKHVLGDAIVMFDADVILADSNVIENLVRPIRTSRNIGLICGNSQPKRGKTFIENCVNASREAYDNFRLKFKEGNNPYSVEGRIMLVTKKFAKLIVIPEQMFAIDNYLYFLCITKGFEYRFAKSAIVLYRSPSNLKDQISQNTRFTAREFKLESIFGSIVKKEYSVPRITKYLAFIKTFLSKPIYSISILFINLYCKYKASLEWKNINSNWKIATTTKVG